jgi:hypothetical protein
MSGLNPIYDYGLTLLNRFESADSTITNFSSYIKQTLTSPYADKLNDKNLLGWPFFAEIGGYSVWSDWADKGYDDVFVHKDFDSHPNGLGHQLIAEMFYKGYQDIYGKIS